MLQSLHVKNLALIEETEVEFGEGLNILTGETGAGKSLLIGSLNLALGGKYDKDLLRAGAESGLVELVFYCPQSKVRDRILEMDLEWNEDDTIIISRKLQPTKSICKINGETVTARQVKELAELLLDIHGQHEHQSLLHKKNHLAILDAYGADEAECALEEVKAAYEERKEILRRIADETRDEDALGKERALAEFELREITDACLVPGEDEELENRYRKMVNSKKIMESLGESHYYCGNDSDNGAGSGLGRALRAMRSVTMYDDDLLPLEEQLAQIDSLLADFNRDLSSYMADCEFDGEEFARTESRLNLINHLKGKYGNTLQDVLDYGEEKQALLDKLADYDAYMEQLEREKRACQEKLDKACQKLSEIRVRKAGELALLLKESLENLNFLTVQFEIAVDRCDIGPTGYDDVEFMLSTNPGEKVRPLGQVASGGELSRVMLAIKTVLAAQDHIDTLIFDEIDAGISGRTAWKVAEQLQQVAALHQVICITHLPQIAAMCDCHFVIEKSNSENSTITHIHRTDDREILEELARLLGSDALTEAALSNAAQMRDQALAYKEKIG